MQVSVLPNANAHAVLGPTAYSYLQAKRRQLIKPGESRFVLDIYCILQMQLCYALQPGRWYSARYLGHAAIQADTGSGPHPATAIDVLAVEVRVEDHVDVLVCAWVKKRYT